MDDQSRNQPQISELRSRIHTWVANRSHARGILDKAAYHYARAAQASKQEATRQVAIEAYWQVQAKATPVAIQVMEGPALIRRLPVHPGMSRGDVWMEAVRIAASGTPTSVETRDGLAQMTPRGRLKWRPNIPLELMIQTPLEIPDFESEDVV